MANVPYPLTSDSPEEMKGQIYDLIRQLYEDKIGGADLGDVFSLPGDVLTLALADSSGLTKTGKALAVEASSTGGLQVNTNGVGIQLDGATLSLGTSGLKVTTPVSGAGGIVTVVTQIQNGGVGLIQFQYKSRDLTFANGLLTTIGAESGWNDV